MPFNNIFYQFLGGCAALLSAFFFAICSILLRKLSLRLSPLGTNFWKSLAGSALILIAFFFVGFKPIPKTSLILLILSGFLGVAVADTFFFKSLLLIGPRLTLLLETLVPVFTIFLAIIFLNEQYSVLIWLGIILVLIGISVVLLEQTPKISSKNPNSNKKKGLCAALLFCLCMSGGIILTKFGIKNISSLQATFIRLFSSVLCLATYGIISTKIKTWFLPFNDDPKTIKLAIITLILGIFGGFWLSMIALKQIDASIATVLNSTTPLFILPLSAFFSKEKITPRSIYGAIIAVLGIGLIFMKSTF